MHTLKKKSTCILMATIVAATAINSVSALAADPIVLTAPTVALTSASSASTLLPVPAGPSSLGLDISPPGANLSNCVPSKAHPYPVILLSGLGGTISDQFSKLSPILANAGYCVYATNYGVTTSTESGVTKTSNGHAHLEQSLAEVLGFSIKIVLQTGAKKIQFVGHSEGGLMVLALTKLADLLNYVDTVVALAPATRGTDFNGLVNPFTYYAGWATPLAGDIAGPAGQDLLYLSPVIQKWLNQDKGATPKPGVNYTVIATNLDKTVTPYTSQFLDAGPLVNNIDLQKDICQNDKAEHGNLPYDNAVIQLTLNALGGDINGNKGTADCNNLTGAWPRQ